MNSFRSGPPFVLNVSSKRIVVWPFSVSIDQLPEILYRRLVNPVFSVACVCTDWFSCDVTGADTAKAVMAKAAVISTDFFMGITNK